MLQLQLLNMSDKVKLQVTKINKYAPKMIVLNQGRILKTVQMSTIILSLLEFCVAFVFSSPEHNVLRGSYCDQSSSVVRLSVRLSVRPSICPSVNNFFKNLLLQNQKANLDKTWQECSLGEALQNLLKEFNSNKNSGCHGNKMAENGKNL